MNSDIKPIIDQLKSKLSESNVEEIKKQVTLGFDIGRHFVEAKAKDLYKQSKDSRIVNDYIIPLIESEQANKAIEVLNDKLKLKDTPIMNALLKIRQDFIDLKVSKAKTAETASETEASAPTETTTPNEEPVTTKSADPESQLN